MGSWRPSSILRSGGCPWPWRTRRSTHSIPSSGYKNAQYIRFGWAAARLDDIANYIPARITGLSISVGTLAYFLLRPTGARLSHALTAARDAFKVMLRDGRNHTSPNSGVCEAAMAGALGVRLGGPATSGGSVVVKPYIGNAVCRDHRAAADAAVAIATISSSFTVAFAVAILTCGRLL